MCRGIVRHSVFSYRFVWITVVNRNPGLKPTATCIPWRFEFNVGNRTEQLYLVLFRNSVPEKRWDNGWPEQLRPSADFMPAEHHVPRRSIGELLPEMPRLEIAQYFHAEYEAPPLAKRDGARSRLRRDQSTRTRRVVPLRPSARQRARYTPGPVMRPPASRPSHTST